MDKLKPCPFCGESKYITFKKDSIPDGQCHYYDWVIRYEKCHVRMNIAADNWYGRNYYTEEEAIEFWNKRQI